MHSAKLSHMLAEAARLLHSNSLRLEIREYIASSTEFPSALQDAQAHGRLHAVVLRFDDSAADAPASHVMAIGQSPVVAYRAGAGRLPQHSGASEKSWPAKGCWDLDFLLWDEAGDDERREERAEEEDSLFKADAPDDLGIAPFVDDAVAASVALELGAKVGEAGAVLFWLPGAGEVPEEHVPWLSKLVERLHGLRVLLLKPRSGTKWYETSDNAAVRLGLRYAVADDFEWNPDGHPALSSGGWPTFPATPAAEELRALRELEGAALGLARRCALEERSLGEQPGGRKRGSTLPFFLGGTGQGGSIALYAAACLLPTPVLGVAFCLSGVPVGGSLAKHLLVARAREATRFYAVYDRADTEVPAAFPEAFLQLLRLIGCDASLHWLEEGNGHEFFDDAASKVATCIAECLHSELRRCMEDNALRKGAKDRQETFLQALAPGQSPSLTDDLPFQPLWHISEH